MEGNNNSRLPQHGVPTRTIYSRFLAEAYNRDPPLTPEYNVSYPAFGNCKFLDTDVIQGTSGNVWTETLAMVDKYEDMHMSARNRNFEGRANLLAAMNRNFESKEDMSGDKLLAALKRNFEANAKLLNLLTYQQNILETLKEHNIGPESPKQFRPNNGTQALSWNSMVPDFKNKHFPGTQTSNKSVFSSPICNLKTFNDYDNGNTGDQTEYICSSARSVITSENVYSVNPEMHPRIVAAGDTPSYSGGSLLLCESPHFSFDNSHAVNGRTDGLPVKLSVHPQSPVYVSDLPDMSLDVSSSNEECQEIESTRGCLPPYAFSSNSPSVSNDLSVVCGACLQLDEEASGSNEECKELESSTSFLAPKTVSDNSFSVSKDLSTIFNACVQFNEEKENNLLPIIKNNIVTSESLHVRNSKAGNPCVYDTRLGSPCHSSVTRDSNVEYVQSSSMGNDMKTPSNAPNVFSSLLPKSISVRVKGSPLSLTSGSPSSSPLRQKKCCTLRFGTEGGEALELYSQGSYKTELCNKWESDNFNCPYGKRCRFAHGLEELRIVARHNKYKTEVCRMIATGKSCTYGHRCHFQHTIKDRQILPELPCYTSE